MSGLYACISSWRFLLPGFDFHWFLNESHWPESLDSKSVGGLLLPLFPLDIPLPPLSFLPRTLLRCCSFQSPSLSYICPFPHLELLPHWASSCHVSFPADRDVSTPMAPCPQMLTQYLLCPALCLLEPSQEEENWRRIRIPLPLVRLPASPS